jgi:LDH2 family malate/lactate/ureidoglycolate dehydrogenase
MVIAIDIGLAASGDVFQAEVDRYIRDLRDTHDPVPGKDRIRLPAHIEEERTILHRREGIHFGEQEKRAMQALHEHYRVALPWD